MPIKAYFKGRGRAVMRSMQRRYGKKRGRSVFYAVANSRRGMKPKRRR